jgi:hypothetical protein
VVAVQVAFAVPSASAAAAVAQRAATAAVHAMAEAAASAEAVALVALAAPEARVPRAAAASVVAAGSADRAAMGRAVMGRAVMDPVVAVRVAAASADRAVTVRAAAASRVAVLQRAVTATGAGLRPAHHQDPVETAAAMRRAVRLRVTGQSVRRARALRRAAPHRAQERVASASVPPEIHVHHGASRAARCSAHATTGCRLSADLADGPPRASAVQASVWHRFAQSLSARCVSSAA